MRGDLIRSSTIWNRCVLFFCKRGHLICLRRIRKSPLLACFVLALLRVPAQRIRSPGLEAKELGNVTEKERKREKDTKRKEDGKKVTEVC